MKAKNIQLKRKCLKMLSYFVYIVFYNCMDRQIPACNQLIVNKINQKNLQLHQQRLHNIKSSQYSRSFISSSLNARQSKGKAQQLEEDKKTEIQKQNLLLFNKMKKIMNRNEQANRLPLQHSKGSRQSMELTRIEEQNRTMYERIEKQKPTINNKKFYEERKKNLNILKFLGKYSAHSIQSANAQSLRASQSSSRALHSVALEQRRKIYTTKHEHYLQQNLDFTEQMNKRPRYDHIELDEQIVDDEDFRVNLKDMLSRNQINQNQYQKKQKTQFRQDEGQDIGVRTAQKKSRLNSGSTIPKTAKDIVLYKINKKIKEQTYQIKIIRKHETYEIRCIPITNIDDYITLELSQVEGNQMLEANSYNYKAIIDGLAIRGEQIILNASQTNFDDVKLNDDNYQQEKPIMFKKSTNKAYQNSSHITEQNQEESYRPYEAHNEEGNNTLVEEQEGDSLGPQQPDQYNQAQEHQHQQSYKLDKPQPEQSVDENQIQRSRQLQITFKPNSNYEEALDQQIL